VNISVGVVRLLQLEAVVDIKITILDVNDNPPTFAEPRYEVHISETARPDFSVALPLANDADTARHGVSGYQLKTSFSEFQLRVGTYSKLCFCIRTS